MKVFLCGGGCGVQTVEAYKKLNAVIDHSKPCLYIPLAMKQEMYDGCLEWITGELKSIDVPHIKMVRSAAELACENMADYSFLFIGGGNTFKLLGDLKSSGAFQKIKSYLENGGVAFGGSAGAVIFGRDLEACRLDDANEVNLKETDGFDLLNGISVLCHFTNNTAEKDDRNRRYLLQLSKRRNCIALPEEVTLFVNGGSVETIGSGSYYYFENGRMTEKI